MKPFLLTLCLALLPMAFGLWVNATAPHRPTRAYVPTRCTRYCTTHGCRHATRANSPLYYRLRPLYATTVAGLAVAGWQWYAALNIGVYLVVIPALLCWLTYGVVRNARTIRQLKARL